MRGELGQASLHAAPRESFPSLPSRHCRPRRQLCGPDKELFDWSVFFRKSSLLKAESVVGTWLQSTDTFPKRHIGPSAKESSDMLTIIGAKVLYSVCFSFAEFPEHG